MRAGGFRRGDDLGLAGAGFAERDVLSNGVAEQIDVLPDIGGLLAKRRLGKVSPHPLPLAQPTIRIARHLGQSSVRTAASHVNADTGSTAMPYYPTHTA